MSSALFVSFLILAVIATANAQTQVARRPSPKQTAKAAWEGNAIFRTGQDQSYGQLVLLDYAYRTYLSHPDADPQSVLKVINQTDDFYRVKASEAQNGYRVPESTLKMLDTTLSLLGRTAGVAGTAYSGVARDVLQLGSKSYEYLTHDQSRSSAQAFEADLQDVAWSFGKTTFDNAWTLAQVNPGFRRVLDTFWGKQFNAFSSDSYDLVLTKNPKFADSLRQANVASRSEEIDSTVNGLRLGFDKQAAALDKLLTSDKQLLRSVGRLEGALGNQRRRQVTAERNRAELAEQQLEIDGARASVYVLSILLDAAGDRTLARQISIAGNAAVQIAQSLKTYTSTVTTMGSAGQVASSMVLAGGFLGSVVSLSALVSEQGQARTKSSSSNCKA